MKKFLSFMLTLLTLVTFGATLNVNAATTASPYTYTFKSKEFSETTKTNTLNGVSWTLTTDAGYFGFDENRGLQIGSGRKPATTIKLSTNEFTDIINSVTIETSGASGVNATVDVTVGGVSYTPASEKLIATSTAYTFEGANVGEFSINWKVNNKKAVYIKSISIVYGQKPVVYQTLSYNLNYPEGKNFEEQVEKDTEFTITNVPTREGYKFLGWFDAAEGGNEVKTFTITADKTVYAHWQALNPITVTLHHNDGTGTIDTLNGYDDGKLTLPTLADKPELVFDGWYDAAEGGNKIETVNSTIELYAHWRAKKMFTVSFHSEGKEVHTSKGEEHAIVNFPTTDPVKPGYVFTGWYDQLYFGNKVEPSTYKYTENVTLYAHFEKENNSTFDFVNTDFTNYAAKTINKNGITFSSEGIMNQSNKIQIRKSSNGVGQLYNTIEFKNDLKSVAFIGGDSTQVKVYYSNSEITDVTKAQEATLSGNTFIIPTGNKFFRIQSTDVTAVYESIRIQTVEKATFGGQQTMSSLAISYDDVALTANKINLRFGGRIENTLINTEANEYGVIILSSLDAASINSLENLNKTALEALKAKGYAKELNPVAIEGQTYSQFAAVITNITPENYNFEFTAFIYEASKTDANAVVTLAQGKQASVTTLVDTYINNAKELNIPEAVVTVLKKLGK